MWIGLKSKYRFFIYLASRGSDQALPKMKRPVVNYFGREMREIRALE
jgi:hypothetical protein